METTHRGRRRFLFGRRRDPSADTRGGTPSRGYLRLCAVYRTGEFEGDGESKILAFVPSVLFSN